MYDIEVLTPQMSYSITQGYSRNTSYFHVSRRQITKALNEYWDVSVVFVIREEYLAQLDVFMHFLPERKSRFRLEPLRREAAYQAIAGPLNVVNHYQAIAGPLKDAIESEVKELVNELLISGRIEGEFVEPVHLQVVCQRWWSHREGGEASKNLGDTTASLKDVSNVDNALKDFYEEALLYASRQTGISEKDIRNWFQYQLITSSGTRAKVYRELSSTGGMPNTVVEILESRYLIRGELRLGDLWYELTHDRLIKPITDSNREWELLNKNRRLKRYFSFRKSP